MANITRRNLLQAGSLLSLRLFPAAAADAPKVVDLTLKDAAGQKVRLKDLRGKIVLLNFWATWCGPCNAEMPMMVAVAKKYTDRSVVFVGASLDDAKTKAKIPEFLTKYGVTYPIWYGATGDDMDKLSMGEAAPTTAFLDEEGHIVARIWGQMREGEMEERLDWLLGGKKGSAPPALVKHL